MDAQEKEKLLKRIETLQLEKVRMSRSLVELQMLNETFKDINSTLDLDTVLKKIMARVSFCMEADVCTVMLLDQEAGELFVAAAEGMDDETAAEVFLPLGHGIAGWVAEKGEPVLVTDVEKDFSFDERESGMRHGSRSLVCAPLVSKGTVLGVVTANRPGGGSPFTEADLDLLTNIADQAAVCIENARLFAQLRERAESHGEDA